MEQTTRTRRPTGVFDSGQGQRVDDYASLLIAIDGLKGSVSAQHISVCRAIGAAVSQQADQLRTVVATTEVTNERLGKVADALTAIVERSRQSQELAARWWCRPEMVALCTACAVILGLLARLLGG